MECCNLTSYVISHEICHAISCLDFLDDGLAKDLAKGDLVEAWNKRRSDWKKFFSTDRMKDIREDLKTNGFNDDEIKRISGLFFFNTEEARNLLGFNPGKIKHEVIGEYRFAMNMTTNYLPVYQGQYYNKIEEHEKFFLSIIAKNLGINLKKKKSPSGCTFV